MEAYLVHLIKCVLEVGCILVDFGGIWGPGTDFTGLLVESWRPGAALWWTFGGILAAGTACWWNVGRILVEVWRPETMLVDLCCRMLVDCWRPGAALWWIVYII